MNAKTKAKQLYNKIWEELYWDVDIHNQNCINHTKKNCLIMINEIDSELVKSNADVKYINFWLDVKNELNAL